MLDMNSAKNQQIEFDVFPKDNKGNYSYLSGIKSDASPETAPINVIFSHQSIIIVFIGIIMLLVASFTLGVEKGKLVSREMDRPEKATVSPVAQVNPSSAASIPALASTATESKAAPATSKNPAPVLTPVVVASSPALITETTKDETQKTEVATEKPITGSYAIQVATVKGQNSAKRLAENLTKKGWKSFTKSSGEYIIVLAGNFSKREDAQSGVKELKKTYSDCFIKKI